MICLLVSKVCRKLLFGIISGVNVYTHKSCKGKVAFRLLCVCIFIFFSPPHLQSSKFFIRVFLPQWNWELFDMLHPINLSLSTGRSACALAHFSGTVRAVYRVLHRGVWWIWLIVSVYSNAGTNKWQLVYKKKRKYLLTIPSKTYRIHCKGQKHKCIFVQHFLWPVSQMMRNHCVKW